MTFQPSCWHESVPFCRVEWWESQGLAREAGQGSGVVVPTPAFWNLASSPLPFFLAYLFFSVPSGIPPCPLLPPPFLSSWGKSC